MMKHAASKGKRQRVTLLCLAICSSVLAGCGGYKNRSYPVLAAESLVKRSSTYIVMGVTLRNLASLCKQFFHEAPGRGFTIFVDGEQQDLHGVTLEALGSTVQSGKPSVYGEAVYIKADDKDHAYLIWELETGKNYTNAPVLVFSHGNPSGFYRMAYTGTFHPMPSDFYSLPGFVGSAFKISGPGVYYLGDLLLSDLIVDNQGLEAIGVKAIRGHLSAGTTDLDIEAINQVLASRLAGQQPKSSMTEGEKNVSTLACVAALTGEATFEVDSKYEDLFTNQYFQTGIYPYDAFANPSSWGRLIIAVDYDEAGVKAHLKSVGLGELPFHNVADNWKKLRTDIKLDVYKKYIKTGDASHILKVTDKRSETSAEESSEPPPKVISADRAGAIMKIAFQRRCPQVRSCLIEHQDSGDVSVLAEIKEAGKVTIHAQGDISIMSKDCLRDVLLKLNYPSADGPYRINHVYGETCNSEQPE